MFFQSWLKSPVILSEPAVYFVGSFKTFNPTCLMLMRLLRISISSCVCLTNDHFSRNLPILSVFNLLHKVHSFLLPFNLCWTCSYVLLSIPDIYIFFLCHILILLYFINLNLSLLSPLFYLPWIYSVVLFLPLKLTT